MSLSPDFSLATAHRLILAGTPIPPAWRPHITELNFSWSSEHLPPDLRPHQHDTAANRANG